MYKNIVEIDNEMRQMMKQKPFYKIQGQFRDGWDCVFLVEKYVFNNKNYYGKKLKSYVENQFIKFVKFAEDYWGVYIPFEQKEYEFYNNKAFEYVLEDWKDRQMDVLLTPAKETMSKFQEIRYEYIEEKED